MKTRRFLHLAAAFGAVSVAALSIASTPLASANAAQPALGAVGAVPACGTCPPPPPPPPPPNHPPDCEDAEASPDTLWPPNHKYREIEIVGVTDPDGDPVDVTITSIRQDEPTDTVGDGNTCPDGDGVGTSSAFVRAERTGNPNIPGDGRVYYIEFTATDSKGAECTGTVEVCVPHDQGAHSECIGGGALYDSTEC